MLHTSLTKLWVFYSFPGAVTGGVTACDVIGAAMAVVVVNDAAKMLMTVTKKMPLIIKSLVLLGLPRFPLPFNFR